MKMKMIGSRRERSSALRGLIGASLLVFVLVLSGACDPGAGSGKRVLILGIDGMDPQVIDLMMSEGKLPNFAKMRQEGAYGRLESQKPILSPIIWTTIATGKTADQHGIGHFVAQSATGEQLPVTSHMRKVKAIWNIASDSGREVASVGWWATWPPETVNGSMVSDHTAYHFLFEEGLTGDGGAADEGEGGQKTHPPELLAEIEPLLKRPADLTYEELQPYVSVTEDEFSKPFDFQDDLAHFKWALATAESYRDIGLKLWNEKKPDLGLVYIEGTDSTSHLFGHLFRAEGLGGELAEQQKKFGHTVEEIYNLADQIVGEYIDAVDDDTVLMVLSDHGFELGALHDDPSRTRDMRRVSEKFHRLHGILYMYGGGVRPGGRIQDASIIDIAPTVLSQLGLPAAADMPGRVLTEAFIDQEERQRIATYESADGESSNDGATQSAAVSQAQLEHLRSLGYIGNDGESTTVSPKGDRNLAAIHFQNGNYRESAKLYKQLIDADPEDASLRASMAGALGMMQRYDQALVELDKAIELEPLNVEAFHNRAVIKERLGDPQGAVGDYERALRYNPQYEPSQQAYQRLTGRTDVRAPKNEAELKASELVRQASVEARRANYEAANKLLDEAEKVAPTFILTYQYRSNVAYLTGDHALGIVALEKALKFEPDNALFQRNLVQLRAEAAKKAEVGQQ